MKKFNKKLTMILAALLLFSAAVGTTVAYLAVRTSTVTNSFSYGSTRVEVLEDFDYQVKENVRIKNTGDIPVVVRATYVVYWVDSENENKVVVPGAAYDCTIEQSSDTKGWELKEDGYWYYLTPVAANAFTPPMPLTWTAVTPEDAEYTMVVEILTEAIQAEPVKAHEEAWPVTKPKTSNQ